MSKIYRFRIKEKNPLDNENLEWLGKELGTQQVSRIQEVFKQSGWDDKKWHTPRMTPNIPGIIQYLNEHTNINPNNPVLQRMLTPKKPLMETGLLMRSFKHFVEVTEGTLKLAVGTNLNYAKIHHEGGTSEIQITEQAKRNIESLTKGALTSGQVQLRAKRKRIKRSELLRSRFRFLRKFLNKSVLKIQVRQRVLLHFDNTLRRYFKNVFVDWARRNKET